MLPYEPTYLAALLLAAIPKQHKVIRNLREKHLEAQQHIQQMEAATKQYVFTYDLEHGLVLFEIVGSESPPALMAVEEFLIFCIRMPTLHELSIPQELTTYIRLAPRPAGEVLQ